MIGNIPAISQQSWILKVMASLNLQEDSALIGIAYNKECFNPSRGFFVPRKLTMVVPEGERVFYAWIDG